MALFAALSYAITQSGRGGGTVSKETLALDASNIVQYAASVDSAVKRLTIIGGYSDTQISFENPYTAYNTYVNPNCTTPDCKVFSPTGGGIAYLKPPSRWFGNVLPLLHEHMFMSNTYVVGVGTGKAELIYTLADITKELCIEINKKLGVNNPGGNPPVDTGVDSPFRGSYSEVHAFGNEVGGEPLIGQWDSCFQDSDQFFYMYVHVLIAR